MNDCYRCKFVYSIYIYTQYIFYICYYHSSDCYYPTLLFVYVTNVLENYVCYNSKPWNIIIIIVIIFTINISLITCYNYSFCCIYIYTHIWLLLLEKVLYYCIIVLCILLLFVSISQNYVTLELLLQHIITTIATIGTTIRTIIASLRLL